jgi:hypothetical protein
MESETERKRIVQQVREFSSNRGFDLEVVRRVVQLVLKEQEEIMELNEAKHQDRGISYPATRLDMRKMKSVLWLTLEEEHVGDALIAANTLLRHFLLANEKSKLTAAHIFMNDVLPEDLFDRVIAHTKTFESSNEDEDELACFVHAAQIEHARSDYVAFRSYLDAMDAVDHWKDVMAATLPNDYVDENDNTGRSMIDKTQLNATEMSIATSMERREFIVKKRNDSAVVVTAADRVETSLLGILKHHGGWLLTEDEVIAGQGEEEIIRRRELQDLRSRLLPEIVMLYESVCTATASWMSKSLDDTVEQLGSDKTSPDDVIRQLDETLTLPNTPTEEVANSSTLSPISPRYWTQKALELAQICASDTYGIRSAFGAEDYKDLMSRLAEAAVSDMLY